MKEKKQLSYVEIFLGGNSKTVELTGEYVTLFLMRLVKDTKLQGPCESYSAAFDC